MPYLIVVDLTPIIAAVMLTVVRMLD